MIAPIVAPVIPPPSPSDHPYIAAGGASPTAFTASLFVALLLTPIIPNFLLTPILGVQILFWIWVTDTNRRFMT